MFTIVESSKALNVIQVAAGNELSLILTENGDVYSSGYNEMGSSQFGANSTQIQQYQSSKVGQLKRIEVLRGKSVIKLFAANGCEHVIALTSMIIGIANVFR